MFNTDKPISTISKDMLSRSEFVRQLSETIINQPTHDSFVLGLYGAWGSGKTSVLNLLEESISSLTLPEDTPIVKVVRFDPWGYVDSTQLINQFFALLATEFKLNRKDKKQVEVGEAIDKYAFSLEITKIIPTVGPFLGVLPGLARFIGTSIKNRGLSHELDIHLQKNNVESALKHHKKRYVVFIDDIDRLPNEQIRMIFQLVKAIADFPYITYLLAFDKPVVVRALQRVQDCDGDEYLEKIVQVPFIIPNIPTAKIHSILLEKLEAILSTSEDLFDGNVWYRVCEACIFPYIHSLRDVIRYVNVLEFKYAPLRNNINPVDFAGIIALEVFASDLFTWIRQNKEILTKSEVSLAGTNGIAQKLSKDLWLERIKHIRPELPSATLEAITSLFPKIAFETNASYDTISEEQLSKKLRIGSSSRFDLYFTLQFENSLVTYSNIISSMMSFDKGRLVEYLALVYESDGFFSYVTELLYYDDLIPQNRLTVLLSALFPYIGMIRNDGAKMLRWSTRDSLERILLNMLMRIEDAEERFALFTNLIQGTNSTSLLECSSLISKMEYALGRLGSKKVEDSEIVFPEESMIIIEQIYLRKLYEVTLKMNILEARCFSYIALLWDFIDQDSFGKYITESFRQPENILLYIISVASSVWSGNAENYWRFNKELYFMKYLTNETALNTITDAVKNRSIFNFPVRQQIKLAAFVLSSVNQNNHPSNAISEKDAKMLIAEWNETSRD